MQANNSKQKDNTVSKKAGLENKPKNWALYNMRVRKLESDMLLPGWLSAHRDQLRAQRSVTSMGKLYLYFTFTASTATLISGFNFQYAVSYWRLYSHSPKRTVSELWHENNRQTNGPQHCLMLPRNGRGTREMTDLKRTMSACGKVWKLLLRWICVLSFSATLPNTCTRQQISKWVHLRSAKD